MDTRVARGHYPRTRHVRQIENNMDSSKIAAFVEKIWDKSIIPALVEYIRIPNKSPLFDTQWQQHGHMEKAVALVEKWCRQQPIEGLTLEVVRLEGRTPLIFMEIPASTDISADDCVVLYGHLDKQPEMSGWRDGLGPWEPVIDGDRLYGRGGADDGYSAFASLTAIAALKDQGVSHARCVIIIEACEESGSYDLPFYIDALADRIGTPSLVICLDSGCGNYDQLWCTTSLRGSVGGTLAIENLREGVHSGDAGGVIPSTFRILRQLLTRLEDEQSGEIKPSVYQVEIPDQRISQAVKAAEVLGHAIYSKFPFLEEAGPVSESVEELVINRTWRPALAVTGADGLPSISNAGNVARPKTSVKLSLRIPPTCDAQAGTRVLKTLLESDPPYGAKVSFIPETPCTGWNAPALSAWLGRSASSASNTYFGAQSVYMGEGGSIPFMGMLGGKFPDAQFLITGVLGPHSNAHGPNEFLHLPTGKKITCCVASVLADHL